MSNNQLLAILRLGRARIAQGWCVGNFAQTRGGGMCHPSDPEAVHWCARGAVGSDWNTGINEDAEAALYAALPAEYQGSTWGGSGNSVANFNNHHRTQADVLALFDRAIAKLQPAQRPTSAMLADLMARVNGERIPEDVT